MSEDKSTLGNMVDAAKAKINEGADRARAAGHDLASHVGSNPAENAMDKAQATEDRAKAELHNRQANAEYTEGKSEAKDGDGR
ncbi:hypothetical protein [Deinococcus sp. QL22]|uniref:hypothetical protein n=1 Tax=Deinococcus sp. QL22 TaxID=2939437 RepID=UPI002016FD6D|nr:hypothetical protein [Deinococcus sp. QL22]UQN06387.1 hypothetical protein M1R55_00230 [Deinococcus sp. QL22]